MPLHSQNFQDTLIYYNTCTNIHLQKLSRHMPKTRGKCHIITALYLIRCMANSPVFCFLYKFGSWVHKEADLIFETVGVLSSVFLAYIATTEHIICSLYHHSSPSLLLCHIMKPPSHSSLLGTSNITPVYIKVVISNEVNGTSIMHPPII